MKLAWLGLLIFVCHANAGDAPLGNPPPTAKPIEDGDWTSYNYDSNGWRYNDQEHTLSPDNINDLELKWKFPKAGSELQCGVIHATPSVVDGYIYFGTASLPNFYCITPVGEVAWSFDLTQHRKGRGRNMDDSSGHLNPQDGVYTSALVTDNAVYFGDAAGVMYCLDRVTGQQKWLVDSHAEDFPGAHRANIVMGSPTLVDDKVVFGGGGFEHSGGSVPGYECCSGRGFVIGIYLDSGQIAWKYDVGPEQEPILTNVGDPVMSGISLAGGLAFCTTMSSNKFLCLNAETGELLKKFPIGPVLSSPSISNGNVYVGTGNTLFGSTFYPTKFTGELLVFGLASDGK